jgi:dTDP-4-dehydrorhamnose reductase
MKWLVTGASGMLGRDLVAELRSGDHEVLPLAHSDLDITDARSVRERVSSDRPDIIVNCAAYTRVDDAEKEEDEATKINGTAVANLAVAADSAGALLIQISTDFVFHGTKRLPYEVDDPTAPLSAYGRTKLLGEEYAANAKRHLIIRTSWLFGVHGNNFVEAIRRQVRNGNRDLRVVDDQRGRPTFTPHLAAAIRELGERAAVDPATSGIVHYADRDDCTWFDFAREIVARVDPAGATKVRPVSSEEFSRPAQRPGYSVLSTERYEKLAITPPFSWRDGLEKYLELRPE